MNVEPANQTFLMEKGQRFGDAPRVGIIFRETTPAVSPCTLLDPGRRGTAVIYIMEGVTRKPGILPVLQDVVMNYPGLREIYPDRSGTCL